MKILEKTCKRPESPEYGVKQISSYFDIFMIFVYFLKRNLKNYASWSLRLWKHRGYIRHALNFPKIYFGNPRITGTLIYRIFSPTPLPPVCLDIPPLQYFPYIYIYDTFIQNPVNQHIWNFKCRYLLNYWRYGKNKNS